jgi:gluconate 2-dehydrogenase gamma chain
MMDFSRRDLLKHAGLAGAAIVAMPELSRVLMFQRELSAQARTLTSFEFATLEAMCARLIPTDENGPGAIEARAAHYIDRALGGFHSSFRQAYEIGLASIDAQAQKTGGAPFVKLSPAQQDAVLTAMEQTAFFGLVRGHTLQGTFCDPSYGGNANFVGWDLIGYPGVRLTVTAAEQNMSTPAKPVRRSAYDYVMFSKAGMGM